MSESESIYDSEQYDSEQGEVFDEEFAPDADGEADPEAEDWVSYTDNTNTNSKPEKI